MYSEVHVSSVPEPKSEVIENPDFLPLATVNEFLPPISNWTTIGGIVLLSIFGASFTLAGILKYQVTIKTPATIRPAGELRLVQATTEGTIKSIAVQANQQVKQGDVIAYIDDSRLKVQKNQLQMNIQQGILQLSLFDAQIRAIDGQIDAEKERINRVIASAKAEFNHSQRDLQDKQVTSISQVQEVEANLQQVQQELQKNQVKLKSAQANLKSSHAALNAAKARRYRYQPLAKIGSISIDQFQEAQLAVEQQEQLVESQKANVEEQITAIKQQQKAVESAAARRKAALTVLNPSNANVVISQEKMATENAIGKANLNKLTQQREQLLQQKVEIQKQLNGDKEELQQVIQEISDSIIRASASGIIQELNLRNTSQLVRSGDMVAQIAPSDSPAIAKALVSSEDIRKVEKGQQVQIRVSSCSYTEYGTLKGKVSSISPDVMKFQGKDVSIAVDKSAVYEVQIQPESLELTAGTRKCTIQAGMEGRADIISSEETVLQFFLRKARLLTDL